MSLLSFKYAHGYLLIGPTLLSSVTHQRKPAQQDVWLIRDLQRGSDGVFVLKWAT